MASPRKHVQTHPAGDETCTESPAFHRRVKDKENHVEQRPPSQRPFAED